MSYINAKKEFLRDTEDFDVACARIFIEGRHHNRPDIEADLKLGYTADELDAFLTKIDIEYNNGFGGQELFGTIWCEKGVWFTRYEYDGSESWEQHEYPPIPDTLISERLA
jgi:hypothetical protein